MRFGVYATEQEDAEFRGDEFAVFWSRLGKATDLADREYKMSRFWSTNLNQFSPTNGQEMSSSVCLIVPLIKTCFSTTSTRVNAAFGRWTLAFTSSQAARYMMYEGFCRKSRKSRSHSRNQSFERSFRCLILCSVSFSHLVYYSVFSNMQIFSPVKMLSKKYPNNYFEELLASSFAFSKSFLVQNSGQ